MMTLRKWFSWMLALIWISHIFPAFLYLLLNTKTICLTFKKYDTTPKFSWMKNWNKWELVKLSSAQNLFCPKGNLSGFCCLSPPTFLSCDLFKKLSWVVKAAVQRSPISWSYLPIYELWYRLKYSKVMFEMYRMPYAYK